MSTILWEGISIDLSYTQPSYCAPHFHHIALKANERIPVTETGYRSHFIAPAELTLWETPEAFVIDWLNDAAKHSDWQEYRQQSRQLSLF